MKLSIKASKRIAALINSIEVSYIMRMDPDTPYRTLEIFNLSQARATVELADSFGIVLPGLDNCRRQLETV